MRQQLPLGLSGSINHLDHLNDNHSYRQKETILERGQDNENSLG